MELSFFYNARGEENRKLLNSRKFMIFVPFTDYLVIFELFNIILSQILRALDIYFTILCIAPSDN